jgi:hypothetical protein
MISVFLIGIIILLVILAFSLGGAYMFWNLPETQKKYRMAFNKFLEINKPPNDYPFFGRQHFLSGIDQFNNGWDSAKKSFKHFLLWLGFLPVIIPFWILSKLFKRETPKYFIKVFPPPHPGGRNSESLDEEALELFYSKKSIPKVWEVMKPKYIEQAINHAKNPDKARDAFRDNLETNRLFKNFEKRLNRKVRQNYTS